MINRDLDRCVQTHREGVFAVGMEHAPMPLAVTIELMQPRVEIARRCGCEIDLVHRGRLQL